MADSGWLRINAVEAHLDARTMNSIVQSVLKRKATSITKDPDLRKDIGEHFVSAVTPYVPMRTGKLRDSGRATSDGRLYWTAHDPTTGVNYAPIQYNTQFRRYTTPGTGPYWVRKVQPGTPDWEEFKSAITPLIIRRFGDG